MASPAFGGGGIGEEDWGAAPAAPIYDVAVAGVGKAPG